MMELRTADQVARTLGARIRMLRLAGNLSQAELASMANASLSSVRRLEADGQGTLQLVVRVAQALHATDGLESLFAPQAASIAEADAVTKAAGRQRARQPAAGRGKA